MNPKKHDKFKGDIASQVGVHQNVVDDFIKFYYDQVRKNLSSLTYPRIYVEGLGTFAIRKKKLEKSISKNKDILGNIHKRTYRGYEKSVGVTQQLEDMVRVLEEYEAMLKRKNQIRENRNGTK
jgi:nucleoid DNA-binding protein